MVFFCCSYSSCTSELRPLDSEVLLSISYARAAVLGWDPGANLAAASEHQLSQLHKP